MSVPWADRLIHSTPQRVPPITSRCPKCYGPLIRSHPFVDYAACQRVPHYFVTYDWDDREWRDEASWEGKPNRYMFNADTPITVIGEARPS